MRIRDPKGYFGLNWGSPTPVNMAVVIAHFVFGIPFLLWICAWTFWVINKILVYPVWS